MKKNYAPGIVLILIATMIMPSAAAIEIGGAMIDADVKMKNVDGSMSSINDVKGGKGTLVIFTCNHCPFVMGWQETMVELSNSYQKKGIGVIFINANDPDVNGDSFEGMQKLAKAQGYQFAYVVDETSNIARHFGAKKTPDVFLFEGNGKLVYQGAVGEGGRQPKSGGETFLKNAMDAVVAGKPVKVPQTKAVGCGIKFR